MQKENCYGDFAYIYDKLTDDVEYDAREKYLEELIKKHLGKQPELVCDLGCGTGTICSLMSKKGYDMIGIDNSPDMLNVASKKNTDGKILFLNQDICDFELYGTVDVFLSLLDTLNYITDEKDVEHLFSLVHNYLNSGGIFIFDVNSQYKFENILGDNTLVFETDDIFYTWENCYEDEQLDFYLNFFVKEKNGLYERFSEQHSQRYYDDAFLKECAKNANLIFEKRYADKDFADPGETEERIFYVFRKPEE